jgi:hypothetical protein
MNRVPGGANLAMKPSPAILRTVSAGGIPMDPQLLETLTQSQWAIAFVTAAVATVWLRQRGKTQRAALLCAAAYDSADSSIPRAELLEAAKSTKVSTFAQIVLAFGKLPEVTQRRCTTMGIVMICVTPFLLIFSMPIFAIRNLPGHQPHYDHRVYNSPSYTTNTYQTGTAGPSATKSAVSTPRSTPSFTPAQKSPPALPDRISVVSVSATLESEAMSPSPPPNPIDTGVASFPRPTIDSLIAADSHSMPVDGSVSQRQGRFDRLAALTQWSCHDNATATARMEF